jgi:hypothetical protein
MISFAVSVPNTLGNTGTNATQLINSSTSVYGKATLSVVGVNNAYCMYSATAPTVATVLAQGTQITASNPLEIFDPNGSPIPDLANYYAATDAAVGGASLRVFG